MAEQRYQPSRPPPVKIVLFSPRACRSVLLEGLTEQARAGILSRGELTPTLRSALQLLDTAQHAFDGATALLVDGYRF